jgi:Arc/MetJ-type ribon-helix-helix transcriptional regulator
MENRKEWRRSISLPEELERAIVELRKDDRYTRLSYSEIIRQLIQAGLNSLDNERTTA